MGEDAKNEHALGLVVDPGNQPVVVAMDIENGPSTDDVRVREVLPYIGQRFPIRSLGDPIPVEKRDQSILMPSGEFEDGWLADHPHDTSLQNVNLSVKGERCPSRRRGCWKPRLPGSQIPVEELHSANTSCSVLNVELSVFAETIPSFFTSQVLSTART